MTVSCLCGVCGLVYGTAARRSPKVLYTCVEINVFYLFCFAGFVQARGPAYRAPCGLRYVSSVKGSLPTAQQIFNLQGGSIRDRAPPKGGWSSNGPGRDPPSGGSGVLVPWTLDSRQQKTPEPIEGEGCALVLVSEECARVCTVFVL